MATTQQATAAHTDDDGNAAFEALVRERVAAAQGPLFETDAKGLFHLYLDKLPANRQCYHCHACRGFLRRYGGLATIDDAGRALPLLWDGAGDRLPPFFADAVRALERRVAQARVRGVFLSAETTWGVPVTTDHKRGTAWTHLSAENPNVFRPALRTAAQVMAEKREDYAVLKRGLDDFALDAVRQAVRVLEADALDRGEKALGVARWLLSLDESLAGKGGPARDNLVWRAVATAPPGFCHVRSSMISTLLADVVAGLDFAAIRRRWADKMHPLRYRRPTAPPKEGTIDQAEKVVARLGSAGALERRFARLDDILAKVWEPTPAGPKPGAPDGVFGNLRHTRQAVKQVELPPVRMTWEKFRRAVLPDARSLEYRPPPQATSFYGLMTAQNADAPPILQWDGLEGRPRNPASWYYYHGGTPASRWGLAAGAWVRVNAVCLPPFAWQEPEKLKHHGESVLLVLEGCRDLEYRQGAGFFPEFLRAEYHGVRSVLEAHARQSAAVGKEEGTANGLGLQRNVQGDWACFVRVNGSDVYHLDRWD